MTIVDHLTCPLGCFDEYHVVRPFDQEYTERQMANTVDRYREGARRPAAPPLRLRGQGQQLLMRVSRRHLLASVVFAGGIAISAMPSAVAHGEEQHAGVDACDWASFRNSPGNHGASECESIGLTNVSTLRATGALPHP